MVKLLSHYAPPASPRRTRDRHATQRRHQCDARCGSGKRTGAARRDGSAQLLHRIDLTAGQLNRAKMELVEGGEDYGAVVRVGRRWNRGGGAECADRDGDARMTGMAEELPPYLRPGIDDVQRMDESGEV